MRLHPLLHMLWPIVGLLTAVPSHAYPWPSQRYSTVPPYLTLVGLNGASADTSYPFKVIIKNSDEQPCQHLNLQLDFSAFSDISLCTDQHDPGVSLDCASRIIRGLTDQNGEATFHIVGCARNGGAPGPDGSRVRVYCDGFFMGLVQVVALDPASCDGLNGNDYSLFLGCYFSGQMYPRLDYDHNGVLTGNDFSIWMGAFFGGTSQWGCWSAVCQP